MEDKKLLEAVSAALKAAGYTDIAAHDTADGAHVTAKKGEGAAYFRVTDKVKAEVPMKTTFGEIEKHARPLEAHVVPVMVDLREHLLKNRALAPAFGIPDAALEHLK
jgi:hypothetical protein